MEKAEKKAIIDVIPLTRLPLSRQQSFSYLHHEEIPFGTLVSIPLFRRNVKGIVINNRDDFFRFGNIKLRKIDKILDESLITENQLKLAEFISKYYICPLGIVLKFFVAKKTKLRNIEQKTYNKKRRKIYLNKKQKIIANNILKNNSSLLISGTEGIPIFLELIEKNIECDKQSLILIPEIPIIYSALEIIKDYFDDKNIVLFHSQLKGGEFYSAYSKIKSGKAKIIIGTRQAILSPFKNLGLIIISEEQDVSYKQWDMNPRYNARDVAYKLSEIYNAKLVLSSSAPSIETYRKFQSSKSQILNNFQNLKLKIQNSIDIVDMRKEGWNKNSRKRNNNIILSQKLISEIGYSLKHKKTAFLFVNRRGMSNFSICSNCKKVLRCPRCERALIYDNEGYYRCLHCSYKTDIFPKCPECEGTNFKNIGFGNQSVENEIKKIFPNAQTKIIDFESLKNKEDQRKIFHEINNKKYDVLIGTQTVLKGWTLPYLELVALINADEILSYGDFNSDERAFQIFIEAKAKIEDKKDGKLIIQSYHPENHLINYIIENNHDGFYEKILEERKALKYPPFCRIIKLTLRTPFKAKLEKESASIFERLKILSEKNRNISVFNPLPPQLSKIRNKFRKQVVIKIEGETVPNDLEKTFENLDSDWIIDVDPISII